MAEPCRRAVVFLISEFQIANFRMQIADYELATTFVMAK
jgi:hypothetical protein